ncbi:MAG: response regulator transcription factor, partial [Ktedonobacterales bacterium]
TIAVRLHISEHTAKFHVSAIMMKLGAASRTEAVTRGARLGLLIL